MGIFDKIKNILFEDEEVEIPVISKSEPEVPAVKKESVTEPRFKTVKKETVEESTPITEEVVNKSPFQTFDEEEFEKIAALNRSRLLERDKKAREAKEEANRYKEDYVKPRNNDRVEVRKDVERSIVKPKTRNMDVTNKSVAGGTHNFRPSPVISPVYGILDKNYKKEDILPRASSEGTLPKVMDVDNVRKKAFGSLEKEIEKTQPLKLFFNEDEPEKQVDELLIKQVNEPDVIRAEELPSIDSIEDNLVKTAEIKITNFEEEVESEPVIEHQSDIVKNNNDDIDSDVDVDALPKRAEKEKLENDTLESDLFNLIDSMYENREEEK